MYFKLNIKRSLFSEFLWRDVVNNINLPNVSTDGAVDGRAEHVFWIERHPQQTLQAFLTLIFWIELMNTNLYSLSFINLDLIYSIIHEFKWLYLNEVTAQFIVSEI